MQETRFVEENIADTQNYRIIYGKPAIKIMKGMPLLGTAFYIHKGIREKMCIRDRYKG